MKKLLLIITFACVQVVWCAEDTVINDLNDVDNRTPLYDRSDEGGEFFPSEKMIPFNTVSKMPSKGYFDLLFPTERLKQKSLWARGILFNLKNHPHWLFPLHVAIRADNFFAVQALLNAGTDTEIEGFGSGLRPLHLAVKLKSLPITQALLAAHANIHHSACSDTSSCPRPEVSSYSEGGTPLHMAAEAGDPLIVQALLKAGANMNVKNYSSGRTPLDRAIQKKHFDVALVLLTAGAFLAVDAGKKERNLFYNFLESLPLEKIESFVYVSDRSGNTPVTVARTHKRVKAEQLFIDADLIRSVKEGRVGALLTLFGASSEGSFRLLQRRVPSHIAIEQALAVAHQQDPKNMNMIEFLESECAHPRVVEPGISEESLVHVLTLVGAWAKDGRVAVTAPRV